MLKTLTVLAVAILAITSGFLENGKKKYSEQTQEGCWRLQSGANKWHSGFEGSIKMPAVDEINGWTADLHFNQPVKQLNFWMAKVIAESKDHKHFSLRSHSWSGRFTKGQDIVIPFVVHFEVGKPVDYTPCFSFMDSVYTPKPQPSTTKPTPTASTSRQTTLKSTATTQESAKTTEAMKITLKPVKTTEPVKTTFEPITEPATTTFDPVTKPVKTTVGPIRTTESKTKRRRQRRRQL